MVKKRILTIILTAVMILSLCSCGKKNIETSSETKQDNIVHGPYEEYVMDNMFGDTLSIKVPESFLIYGEDTINYQGEETIYLSLNVNDGTNAEIEENLTVTLYERDESVLSEYDKFDYVIESYKNRYEFELIQEETTANGHTLWIEGVNPDHDFEKRSSKIRMVAHYVDLDGFVVCCLLVCDYSLKEHEEIVSFEEFETVVKSVVLEMVPPVTSESIVLSEIDESTITSETIESETPTVIVESATSAEQTESVVPEPSTESEPVVEVTYEKDDWRSAGFYVDGNYGKLPMTYEELKNLGFEELKFSTRDIDENDTIEALKSFKYGDLDAYNTEGELLLVDFCNETETEQQVKDCTIYAIRFTRPDHELRSGEDVELCNGLSWGASYAEAIELMGEPDKNIDLTNEYGYNGELYYYFDENSVGKYICLNFFKDELEGIYITVNPIK